MSDSLQERGAQMPIQMLWNDSQSSKKLTSQIPQPVHYAAIPM